MQAFLKVNRLMLRDWIMLNNEPHQIKNLRSIEDKRYQPILITEEILKKNGFEFINGTNTMVHIDWDHNNDVYYNFSTDYLQITPCIYNLDCKYVHELQHAMRIVGLDMLADNFKI